MGKDINISINKETYENFLFDLFEFGTDLKLENIPVELHTKQFCLQYFNNDLRGDKIDLSDIKYINSEFMKDKNFILNLVEVNPKIIQKLLILDKTISTKAVMTDPDVARFVPLKHIQNNLETFIKLCPLYVAENHTKIFEDVKDKSIYYEKLIISDFETIELLPENIVVEVFNRTELLINNINLFKTLSRSILNLLSEDIIEKVLSKDGTLIRYLMWYTDKMVEIAIKENPIAGLYTIPAPE